MSFTNTSMLAIKLNALLDKGASFKLMSTALYDRTGVNSTNRSLYYVYVFILYIYIYIYIIYIYIVTIYYNSPVCNLHRGQLLTWAVIVYLVIADLYYKC